MFTEQIFRVKGFAAARDRGAVPVGCTGTVVPAALHPGEVLPEERDALTVLFAEFCACDPAMKVKEVRMKSVCAGWVSAS